MVLQRNIQTWSSKSNNLHLCREFNLNPHACTEICQESPSAIVARMLRLAENLHNVLVASLDRSIKDF